MVFVCALQLAPSHWGKLHFGYLPELYLSPASWNVDVGNIGVRGLNCGYGAGNILILRTGTSWIVDMSQDILVLLT